MKNMSQANEINQAPIPGKRMSTCVAQATGVSSKGAPMITLTWQIDQGQDGAGIQCDDYLITDGSSKGAGMARRKMRSLLVGTPWERTLDTDEEIADEAIASYLLGKKMMVEYGNEPRMTRSTEGGPYDKPMTTTDNTGKLVSLNKLNVQGYARHVVNPTHVAMSQQPQYQPPVQQAPQAPPQWQQPASVQPSAQTQMMQQAYAPQPGQTTMQPAYQMQPAYPTQQPGQPQPQAQAFPPGFQQAAPPWANQQPVPGNGQAPQQVTEVPKRKRKLQTVDVVPKDGEPQA